jgi:hypothetical protein
MVVVSNFSRSSEDIVRNAAATPGASRKDELARAAKEILSRRQR